MTVRRPLPLVCHPSIELEDLEPGDPHRAYLEEVERHRLAAVAELDRRERRRRLGRIAQQGVVIALAFLAGHLWARPRNAG
jgi:hypothetical protein